jgi:DNA-binding IclR family transcriptional regulator
MPHDKTTPRKIKTTRSIRARPSSAVALPVAQTRNPDQFRVTTPALDGRYESAGGNGPGAQFEHRLPPQPPAQGETAKRAEPDGTTSSQPGDRQGDRSPGDGTLGDGQAENPGAHPGETHRHDDGIAAVGQTLDILEALARVGPAPIAPLAEAAGCTRTAALRLLRTLQAHGFALQDEPGGVWRLGARWSVLGRAAAQQGALAATAMPFLAALGKTTGENIYLIVRDGLECATVAIYQADPSLRLYSEVGKRRPLHAGPSRLLLTHAPEAVQTQVLAQRLPRFTPATRTDAAWIAADLQRIRVRDYLITADEEEAGAVSISGPVRDASGHVVAALSITAPSMRMRPPRPRALLPLVLDAAVRLSQALGQPAAGLPPAAKNGVATAATRSAGGIQRWEPQVTGSASPGPHSIFR